MADIDSIISGVGGNTRANFSGLAEIVPSYWAGLDQAFKQRQRDQFKDGVPTDDAGNVDYGAVQRTLLQNGSPETAAKFGSLTLGQQQLKLADQNGRWMATGQDGTNIPPSASRTAGASVAPAVASGEGGPGASTPNSPQKQPQTLMQVVGAQGFPNDQLETIAQSLGRQIGVDPQAPINLNDPQVRKVLAPAIQRLKQMNLGQPVAAGGQPPAAQPATTGAAPDPFAGAVSRGLIPPGVDPQRFVAGLKYRAAALPEGPAQKAAVAQLEAINKATEPTGEMRNAAAAGMSPREYADRSDTAQTERAVLTSILPKLDKSQEGATAARDEIQAIDRAREQLDAPGGIVAGKFANQQLMMQKVGSFFGLGKGQVANTEAFSSAIGSRTLALVKGLGAGAGISNADRDFAAAMAGGNITLDETSIRRILNIGERAARAKIKQHNSLVGRTVKTNDALRQYADTYDVAEPAAYQRAQAAKGAPPPAGAIQALRSNPALREQFDAKYGAGASASVLGGQ